MGQFRVGLFEESGWLIAQCLDVDVTTQGGSEAEALENMQLALRLHFQAPTAAPDAAASRSIELVAGHLERPDAALGKQPAATFLSVRLRLQGLGFTGISQIKNHAKFIRKLPDGRLVTAVVPHYSQLPPAVVSGIGRQAGLSEEELAGLGI